MCLNTGSFQADLKSIHLRLTATPAIITFVYEENSHVVNEELSRSRRLSICVVYEMQAEVNSTEGCLASGLPRNVFFEAVCIPVNRLL